MSDDEDFWEKFDELLDRADTSTGEERAKWAELERDMYKARASYYKHKAQFWRKIADV